MTTLAEEVARTFGSPAVMIDLDQVERNIARLQAACDAAGLANRPHIKTHKSPVLARLQQEAGARGLTCQTLGEAEVMAEAGLSDILISYNLVGPEKLERLARLLRRMPLTVSADHPAVVEGLGEAAAAAERPLDVVVECDTGRARAGVATPAEAVALARMIAGTPALRFAGLLLYPPEDGVQATQGFLDAVQAGLAGEGLQARIVSTGGTPNLKHLGAIRGATEHRAGTFIFNDRMMMACGAATLADCALDVVATVVSRATPERGVLDAGSKTLTADPGGGLDGYGLIREVPQARIHKLAEEHGFLDLAACPDALPVGAVVRVVPNHVCVVVNMVDRLVTTRGGRIIGEIPVAARGLTG
ncbi:D-TA family PLP-dependent enzyme [Methylobacterium nodulans]|uniref:Alanine racemase domain protein n=1 Tax=Methylobacterium nodulans (strain LMG 21967 / CNCM I-2342 / ORS 2060) TaxID=460265 RepID=B8ILK4_METNO|nr:D-TA family PLP-dependent enzyme [Methylobacterium nodulans]ACL61979.1 alanine racemase domain protein [Methylobacterium nodulans ORS 2060]